MRTARLEIRALERRDVTRFTTYRNIPEISKHQDWELPYTRDHTHMLLDGQEGFNGPTPGEWVQIAIDDGSGIVGDLAVWLAPEADLAMIGYTLAPEVHGRGYATEAVGAMVDSLFERYGVHRVAATLDPANDASARVLERLGFRYEGRSVAAAPVRGRWEDDDRYAILADERVAWRERTLTPPDRVRLVEITPATVRAVAALATHRSQQRFVSTVAQSYGDALVPDTHDGVPVVPWYRAIEADGQLVGFVMIAAPTPAAPVPYLWRLLIDRWHQGRGIGRRAVGEVARHVAELGAERLLVSYVEARGGPAPFYAKLGFLPTGEVEDGETVAVAPVAELLRIAQDWPGSPLSPGVAGGS